MHEIQLVRSVSNEYRHPAVRQTRVLRDRLVSVKAAGGSNDLVRLGADTVSLPADVRSKRAMQHEGHNRGEPIGCGPNHGLERVRCFRGDFRREADRKEVGKVRSVDDAEVYLPLISVCDRVGGRFERVDSQTHCKTISRTGRHDAEGISAVSEERDDGSLRAVAAADDDKADLLFYSAPDGPTHLLAFIDKLRSEHLNAPLAKQPRHGLIRFTPVA
ncbi:MAG: hypothetical protein WCD38_13585 [Candidatus Tumulicola sp.]